MCEPVCESRSVCEESQARPRARRNSAFSTATAVCVLHSMCVCGAHMAFSAESVLFSNMPLIELRLFQPKAVKNTQADQMRCNLFVSLWACKVEPCEAKTYISSRPFFLVFFENNWKSRYFCYHILNLITSFRHCSLVLCGMMAFFFGIKKQKRH